MTPPALALQGITRRFGSTTALDDVSLHVRAGTVHALLGENGAGKTTLMRIAYGMLRPDAGTVSARGRHVNPSSPLEALAAGIGMVHQHFTLVPAMTVAENLALGGRGLHRKADAIARVVAMAERTGFALDANARVESLSVGAQQRVEIAKALAGDARILILDEPTAVLAPLEIQELLRWLRGYVDAGNAAVIITHKLREALAVADDVTVLRRGTVTHTGEAASASPLSLAVAMVGERDEQDSGTVRDREQADDAAPVLLRLEGVTVMDDYGVVRLHDATLALRAGEMVGVVGVEGAGHRELLRAIARRVPLAGGELAGPSRVGFVPEDRHRDAVLLDRSLVENIALRGAGSRRGVIDWKQERARTARLLEEHDVRASSPDAKLRSLSGGNQQKLVVARELAPLGSGETSTVVVAENPTRGLDVHATAAVHDRLRRACAQGAVVVFYSSDLDEVLALATRVLVLFGGRVRELPPDRDGIARGMLGLD